MHEESYVLAPEDFFRKLDDSLRINKNVIISMIFFLLDQLTEMKSSQQMKRKS
jgi:hypothetical protein